jgi:dipeptidyl aminopeptidase/acylaminoacyl peptidase
MNADGTRETHLTNLNYLTPGVFQNDVAWSPDGEKIAFKSASSGNNDIYTINADGSGRTNLTNSKQSEDFFAWSPVRVGTTSVPTEETIEDQPPIDAAPQDEALQVYIEQINELREKDQRACEAGSNVRQLAREKTLQVLTWKRMKSTVLVQIRGFAVRRLMCLRRIVARRTSLREGRGLECE